MSSLTTSTTVCPSAARAVTCTTRVPAVRCARRAPVFEAAIGERRRRSGRRGRRRRAVVVATARSSPTSGPAASPRPLDGPRRDPGAHVLGGRRHDADHTCLIGTISRLSYAPLRGRPPKPWRWHSSSPTSPTASRWRAFGPTTCTCRTKPDLTPVSEADEAVERAIRDQLAVVSRARGARRGVRRPHAGRRRRVPLDHRPDRRHEELRARRADLGDAHRPRTRGNADRRRRRRRPRSACAGGPGAGSARSATASASRCRRWRRSTTRSSRSRGTPRSASRPTASANACSRCRTAAGARAASATSGSTCSSPKARSTSRSIPIVSLWDVAALVPIIEEARRPVDTVDGRADIDGGSFVCTNGVLHDAVVAAARRSASESSATPSVRAVTVGIDIGTSSVKAVAADDDGNVVARSRVPHEFYVPSPLRFEHDAADGMARRTAAGARKRLGDVEPRRRVGRGDGAVVDRRRRATACRARPACSTATSAGHRARRGCDRRGGRAHAVPATGRRSNGPTRAATGWRKPSRTTR